MPKILAIESSCDETSVAVIEGAEFPKIVRNIIASQIDIHKLTNGVVPEVAARAHCEQIIPIIEAAITPKGSLRERTIAEKINDFDAIAVTYGPGLLGSLLIGVEAAKALSFANNIPLIPVNHMEGHIYAALEQRISNFQFPINNDFPALALTVSGGHTELVLMRGHGDYEIVGQTVDDAAGEAFDKVARLMGLPYPGGPEISKLAERFEKTPNSKLQTPIHLPQPMLHSGDLNFSFSGLKTAVVRYVQANPNYNKAELAFAFENAVVDVLLAKTKKAAISYKPLAVFLSGGVAANKRLRETFEKEFGDNLQIAPWELCGDNAGMIGLAAWYRFKAGKTVDWREVNVNPGLSL